MLISRKKFKELENKIKRLEKIRVTNKDGKYLYIKTEYIIEDIVKHLGGNWASGQSERLEFGCHEKEK